MIMGMGNLTPPGLAVFDHVGLHPLSVHGEGTV